MHIFIAKTSKHKEVALYVMIKLKNKEFGVVFQSNNIRQNNDWERLTTLWLAQSNITKMPEFSRF